MNILKIFGLLLTACGAYLLLDHAIFPWWAANQPHYILRPRVETPTVRPTPSAAFEIRPHATATVPVDHRCDGRTHCSQLTSCAEAHYFLANCPGTELDGDGDGIPCEKQWCGPR